MTEDFEDGNYLVRVRAQVMTRDDSTGGWVPMGGGGLSNVSVRKRGLSSDPTIPDDIKHEYLIFGKRISDQSVVLSCIIKKDFEYNKVMPTFHHWKTGDKKFGLTFQTAADARAFDKGVRIAVEELIEATVLKQEPQARHLLPPTNVNGRTRNQRTDSNSDEQTRKRRSGPELLGIHGVPPCNPDVGDDDVFMTLNLPVERGDSRSSSDSSGGKPQPLPPVTAPPEPESYSYVQLTSVHDYMYPVVEGEGSLKKRAQLTLPNKRKERCRHCQESFSNENNVRGSCPYAPDRVRTAIESVACIGLARRVLQAEPCECGNGCGRRWFALALLSLLVPCLWCYPPLRACHFCCVSCGLCGGKHRPAS